MSEGFYPSDIIKARLFRYLGGLEAHPTIVSGSARRGIKLFLLDT
jgi:hypothetical protein